MRKFLYTLIALFISLSATSCLYGVGSDETTDIENTSGFKAEASSNVISANGEDIVTFRAFYNGVDVTAESTLYDATTNEAMESMTFSTIAAGVYTFYITYNEHKSDDIIITAVMDIDLSDKNEEGLSVVLSTNLIQVGKNYAAFIVRYNGKVLLPTEMEKVKIYDTENDTQITLEFVAAENAEGTKYLLPAYYATEAGSKSFWFGYKTKNTRETPLTVTAVTTNIPTSPVDAEPNNLDFVHRTLFTQFTGTWCGNCPYMIAAFHHLFEDERYKDKFVHTAVHNGDPFAVTLDDGRDLGNILNTTGDYPYVLANLSMGIANQRLDENIGTLMGVIESNQRTSAKAAIAARTELKDNMLLVRASIKVSESAEYYIGAWLVESGLYSPQSNYTTMNDDYLDIHENVVRIADSRMKASNFMGHPVGNVKAGERADYLFVMELDPSWVVENCHLVLFASTIHNNVLTVTNAVKTESLTSGVEFEYKK